MASVTRAKLFLPITTAIALVLLARVAIAEPAFLSPAQINPSELLPPPPADGSNAAKAELAELHRIEDTRTAERFVQAKSDGDNETVTLFANALGSSFDLTKLPATAKLFSGIVHDEDAISGVAKKYFHRNRPYVVDVSLKHCGSGVSKGGQTSYPSGHATVAFAMGVVLAELMPAKAQDILSRSADFAESRLVCGVHYRSDIEAGQVLGSVIAIKLMEIPEFQSAFSAAQAELKAKGFAVN